MNVYADVYKGLLPVTGVNATAIVEQPDSDKTDIIVPLLDNGVGRYMPEGRSTYCVTNQQLF